MKKSEMTPLEAAEIMEESARQAKCMIDAPTTFFSAESQSAGVECVKKCEMAYSLAASYLRRIAAGEYKRVVHAHWAVVNTRKISKKVACSWCGKSGWNFQNLPRCPYCGARMGKDDGHE